MLGTIIVGLIVLAVVAAAVRSLHKTLKNGGNLQCGGLCLGRKLSWRMPVRADAGTAGAA